MTLDANGDATDVIGCENGRCETSKRLGEQKETRQVRARGKIHHTLVYRLLVMCNLGKKVSEETRKDSPSHAELKGKKKDASNPRTKRKKRGGRQRIFCCEVFESEKKKGRNKKAEKMQFD